MAICILKAEELTKFNELYPDVILDELPENELLIGYIEENPLRAAGILMAHPENSTMLLDWIFVGENSRRKGYGRAMLKFLMDSCESSGEIDAILLTFYNENRYIYELLSDCGFIAGYKQGCKSFTTRLSRIKALRETKDSQTDYLYLNQVPSKELEQLNKYLASDRVDNIGIDLPLKPKDYREESLVHVANDKIDSLLLVRDEEDGISLPWFFNESQNLTVPIGLMNHVLHDLRMKFQEDTKVFVTSLAPNLENIIYTYFNPESCEEIYIGVYIVT